MKLYTLMENTACGPEFRAEHGLSCYLEANGMGILFDAGQSGAFLENARQLGVDLGRAEAAVLSHGHYDHSGGMTAFLELNQRAGLYLSLYAGDGHFNAAGKDIGMGAKLPANRLIWVENQARIGPGITLCTLDAMPVDNGGMTALVDGRILPEDFRHEVYLLIEEHGKRILLSGCSHKGVVQIAEAFRPDVLIGGFHLMKTEDERILEQTAQRLLALPTIYYTGHCTGQRQYAYLKEKMKNRLHYMAAGTVVEI